MAKPSSFRSKAVSGMRAGLFENKSRHIDARPFWVKLFDYFPFCIPYVFGGFSLIILIFPSVSYLFFWFAVSFILYVVSAQFQFMLDEPVLLKKKIQYRLYDDDGKKQDTDAMALLLIGYDLLFGRQMWLSIDRETRMLMISGTTGSGKTVTQNTLLYQAALQGHLPAGAPILQIDGKGSVSGGWDFFFYYVRAGRVHDVRVVNFNTGGEAQDPTGILDKDVTSNKFNPFSVLNKEESRGLVMSFGKSNGGGNSDFFRDRASTMLAGVFSPLTYFRDHRGDPLDASVIQRFIELRNMFTLAIDKSLPTDVVIPLREYLKTLNGVTDSDFSKSSVDEVQINSKAEEQHTYNRSMLSKTINEMTDTLGHIFCSKGSDVNMRHAIQHGQVIIVFLPTIEKEPDAMSELGRMWVGSLRPALTPLIGYKFQGTYEEVVSSLASNRLVPFRIYMDEVLGYYVKGISNFLSLLRSSMVSITLLGQSLKGMEDAGVSESRQSMANLNNILAFSTQDVFETFEWIAKKLGKTFATRISQMHNSLWGGWTGDSSANVYEEEVVTARDMASADAMEGLYFYRGDAVPFRSATMFPDKKRDGQLSAFYLNFLAELPNPTEEDVKSIQSVQNFLDGVSDDSIEGLDKHSNSNELVRSFKELVDRYAQLCSYVGDQYSNPLYPMMFALVCEDVDTRDRLYSEAMSSLSVKAESKRSQGHADVDDRFVIDETREDVEVVSTQELMGKIAPPEQTDTQSFVEEASDSPDSEDLDDPNSQINAEAVVGSPPSRTVTPATMLEDSTSSLGLASNIDSVLRTFVDDDEWQPTAGADNAYQQDMFVQAGGDVSEIANRIDETPSDGDIDREVSLVHLLRASDEESTQGSSASQKKSDRERHDGNDSNESDRHSNSPNGNDGTADPELPEEAATSNGETEDNTSGNSALNDSLDALLREGRAITEHDFKEVEKVVMADSNYMDKPHLASMPVNDQQGFLESVEEKIEASSHAVDDLMNEMFGDDEP